MIKAADVRRLALSLPKAKERETWGEATFRVGEKIFMILGQNGREASVKARPEHQHSIIASDRRSFAVAPYVGRFGWVTVKLKTVDRAAMRVLIIDAWRLTAPKRLVKSYAAADDPKAP